MKELILTLRKLTWPKTVNVFAVLASYYFSKITGKVKHSGFPLSVSIEPTTSCNLRCPECPSGLRQFTRPTGMLNPIFFEKTIEQLQKKLINLTFYFQGEPYLNPDFLEMVEVASRKGIFTITSTNGHYLNDTAAKKTIESGLDKIIISIDGVTQESYEKYRIGGQLEKALAGTKSLLKWKKQLKSKTPYVVFQFLVVKHNEHEISAINQLAKEMGVDKLVLKTAQVYDFENGNELIPSIKKYARYAESKGGKWKIKNKLLNHCWRMWSGCVITWNGSVIPCCFDKDAKHKLGGLNEKTFKEIWEGKSYNNFRQAVLNSRKQIDICKNCTEGTKVWA